MTYEEIELKLVNRAMTNLQTEINSYLQNINQAIPEFNGKDNYKAKITYLFNSLYNDNELKRAILDSKTDQLFESICMLNQSSLDNLGLTDLCSGA